MDKGPSFPKKTLSRSTTYLYASPAPLIALLGRWRIRGQVTVPKKTLLFFSIHCTALGGIAKQFLCLNSSYFQDIQKKIYIVICSHYCSGKNAPKPKIKEDLEIHGFEIHRPCRYNFFNWAKKFWDTRIYVVGKARFLNSWVFPGPKNRASQGLAVAHIR